MYLSIIVSRRLIDFHLTLLKRISLGKGAQRDKFVPIITKVILCVFLIKKLFFSSSLHTVLIMMMESI
jgi:hypothetical protein